MDILVFVVTPCHQLLDDEKDDDGGDVILYGKYVVPVLRVKETPKYGNDGVHYGQGAIKGELRYLGRRELAISIPKLDDRLIVKIDFVGLGDDAVVSRTVYFVGEGLGFFGIDGFGDDGIL